MPLTTVGTGSVLTTLKKCIPYICIINKRIQTRTISFYYRSVEIYRVVVLCAVLSWCGMAYVSAAPAQLCAAAEDDPRAARFCQALNTFLELYAEAAGEQVPEYQGEL